MAIERAVLPEQVRVNILSSEGARSTVRCSHKYAASIRNRLCLELLVVWRVQRVIGDANVEPVVCVIVSGGPIWVGDAECDRASINAIGGRGRLGSIRGTSYWN